MALKLANNATSTLAASITSSDLTLSVQTGDASIFPTLGVGDWFPLTIVDASGNLEIVKATARSSAVITIVRGQDSTTAKDFASGSHVSLRLTAGSLAPAIREVTTSLSGLMSALDKVALDGAVSDIADLDTNKVDVSTYAAAIAAINDAFDDYATLTGAETLTNKLINSSVFNSGISSQTAAPLRARNNGNSLEFGHANSAGYGCAIGATNSSGEPFILFNGHADEANANKWVTHGRLAIGLKANSAGQLQIFALQNTNTDNQTEVVVCTIWQNGTMVIAGPISLPGNPASALHAAPKQYVDALFNAVPAINYNTGAVNIGYNGVGSYIIGSRGTISSAPNVNYAGSGIAPAGAVTQGSSNLITASGSLSGTWRCMGYTAGGTSGQNLTLFQRVA